MIQSELDAILDVSIAEAEVVKQVERFAGLMRQVREPGEGLATFAGRTPQSIARLLHATDRFRAFVRTAKSISASVDNDVFWDDLGPGSPDEVSAHLKEWARNMAGSASPNN